MEPMLEFLRGCLKHANLDTITKGDMKKNYLEDKGLVNFSKDDKKLFSQALKIALKELTSDSKSSDVESEHDSKVEDMVTEVVPGENVNGNNMESDSDVDFAPDNIEKGASVTEPAFKKKSGRKILSDSDMSADDRDVADVVINEKVIVGTGVSEKKADSLLSLSENDEKKGDAIFRMPNKKKSQKIISDDESSLDVPVERKSNRGKRFHSSSSSENEANSSLTESSPLKTATPKRKKIKVSNDSKEKKSKKLSGDNKASKDKRKIINSSDSEDEIVSKPIKKKKPTTSNKSGTKSTKKNIFDSEEELLASLKKESPVELDKQDTSELEDEPLTNFTKQNKLGKNKLGKSDNDLDKQNTSGSEDEPLTNFTKRNKLGKNKSVKSGNDLDKQNTSESEDEPLANFTESKEGASSKSNSPQKNSSSESEDKEPIINLDKKNRKDVKTLKKTPNKKSAKKNEKKLSDSDDEPLGEKLNTSRNKKANSLANASSCSSADENEEKSPISKKNSKPTKEEKVSKPVNSKKRYLASENKVEYLKKYIRAAGIRVHCYTQLFEKCKSMKAKSEKLLELLEQHGMKGRPTLEKCKKLKKKIERKKEIAELDLSNILKTDGRRSKRSVCSDATNYEKVEEVEFSRLKGIVDSDGSD